MKQIKLIAILLFFGGMMVLYNGCKDDECPCDDPTNPLCENYDPCYGKREINTFFKVRPGDRGFPPPEKWCKLIPCDTFNTTSIRFDIPDGNPDNSTYEWQIGSESEPRTGKGFEIDFSDYIQSKGYADLWIPITLTIRTPMNSCLQNEEETLKTVTRKLFYTKKQLTIFEIGDTLVKYKGYFTHNPNEEVILEHIRIVDGNFRNQNLPITVVVGVPFTDSLFRPGICYGESCRNYIHAKSIIFTDLNHCNKEYDYNISESETIFLKGTERIKQTWLLNPKKDNRKYEFIGDKIP